MFHQSCCDVVSQTLHTLGHSASAKELVLNVKKNLRSHRHAGQRLHLNVAKPPAKGSFASVLPIIQHLSQGTTAPLPGRAAPVSRGRGAHLRCYKHVWFPECHHTTQAFKTALLLSAKLTEPPQITCKSWLFSSTACQVPMITKRGGVCNPSALTVYS